MPLVEIDVVGGGPPQRFLDLLADARGRGVAAHLAVAPFEPDLGRDDRLFAKPPGERHADQLFRVAESVDWRRVDEGDAALDRGADGADGLVEVGVAAPHPPADGPR